MQPGESVNEPRESVDADCRERLSPTGLCVLFGLFYFVQGIAEPTEGLISQPVLSLLKSWGQNAEQIGMFAFLLSLPWTVKPIYGLISDFIPLAGYHRKSYLMLVSAITTGSLCTLYWLDLPDGAVGMLFLLLVLPTIGVAFSDVVIDALMIEKGQPLGLTGRLQSVQWGTIYSAEILTGTLGGYLSQTGQQRLGFLICGGTMLITLFLASTFVTERRQYDVRGNFAATWEILRRGSASRAVLAGAAFLSLWAFNPFLKAVLYLYITRDGLHEQQFYGNLMSLFGIGAMIGSFLYGTYCRRVSLRFLIHGSIVMGILMNLSYLGLHDETSARLVNFGAGLAYATAMMVQLDLAAQIVPPQAAGTLFALLMSLSNLGTGAGTWFGGWCYEDWLTRWGNPWAFQALVVVGALFTAGCWLVVPFLKPALPSAQSD